MTKTSMVVAGIDTAKGKLDVAICGQTLRLQVANSILGWQQLRSNLAKAGVERVGIEATGGYERGVVRHLLAAGLEVLVLQPIQVRAFARLHRQRAKNDTLDAALIAACAAAIEPHEIGPDQRLTALADTQTFVEQIEEDIARFKTRLEHIGEPRLKRMVLADIARLKVRRLAQLRLIAKQLRAHHDLAVRLDLVLSVPGIGERTALALIIRMPELGRISREQASALAGLAPFDDDSGKYRGQRHIAGGRGRLRRSLYAAALPAAFRWNKALISLYSRRENPQSRPGRLRQEASHLRQHCRCQGYPLARKCRPNLMVATRGTAFSDEQGCVGSNAANDPSAYRHFSAARRRQRRPAPVSAG